MRYSAESSMLANFCNVDYGITGMRTLGEENTCQKDEELREPNMLQVVTLHSMHISETNQRENYEGEQLQRCSHRKPSFI